MKRLLAFSFALLLAAGCGGENVRDEMTGEDPSDYRGISGGEQDTTAGIGAEATAELMDTTLPEPDTSGTTTDTMTPQREER